MNEFGLPRKDAHAEFMAKNVLNERVYKYYQHIYTRDKWHACFVVAAVSLLSSLAPIVFAPFMPETVVPLINNATFVALFSAVTSTAAIFGVFPLLRQRDALLLSSAAYISTDNVDILNILGKVVELRDDETAGHNLRVGLYTLLCGEAMGLSPEEIVRLTKGALMHDIGKLIVPDKILRKQGPLSPAERAEMEKHVIRGVEIVAQSHFLQDALPIVSGHHERFDGKGYPKGSKGEDIPFEARLFALIDVFDALTTHRVYKEPLTVEEALESMKNDKGSHFDPKLFDQFAEMAPRFIAKVPKSEQDLRVVLIKRMTPYFDLFFLGMALTGSRTNVMRSPSPPKVYVP